MRDHVPQHHQQRTGFQHLRQGVKAEPQRMNIQARVPARGQTNPR
jgi:hypothetical protein